MSSDKQLENVLSDFLGWHMPDDMSVVIEELREETDRNLDGRSNQAVIKLIRGWQNEAIDSADQLLQEIKEFDRQFETVESWDNDDSYESAFIGTVFAIMPSGKFYMPWTSNQTAADCARDEIFRERLEKELDNLGYWLESGEGDPCDLFVCRAASDNEEEDD